ncbi:hypothetical protein QE152_g8964 [Popillia japonica]|uniref:PiggyBac transposable element-derived protein domain-containing protein n=1 Tax=Popillia japonica TaxID=7064 RepID=A0AAW1M0J6_POPJA
MIYADDDLDVEAIYTEPPEVNQLTDEDFGDEDDSGYLVKLTGRHLRAAVEIRRDGINKDNLEAEETRILSLPRGKTDKQTDFEWISGDIKEPSIEFPSPDFAEFANLTPVEIFELFWDNDLITYLLNETRNYALFKNSADPHITSEEIKGAIRVFILSVYDIKPARRLHWDFKADLGNPMHATGITGKQKEGALQASYRQFIHKPNSAPWCKKKVPYKLHIDNLFTSPTLLRGMRDLGIWCAGTIRDNRLRKGISLPDKASFRGEHRLRKGISLPDKASFRGEHHCTLDCQNGIIFVRWIDNSVVTVTSTCYGVETIPHVKKFSQSDEKVGAGS